MSIRDATPKDAPEILAIWNDYIEHSVATFNSQLKTLAEITALIAEDPVFVADQDGQIAGFATYHQFRSGVGYKHAAEHTIYLTEAAAGKGTGRALMAHLEAHAAKAGFHMMMSGMSAENTAGIAFHAAIGFENPVRIHEVGFKFGRRHDLIFMQKRL